MIRETKNLLLSITLGLITGCIIISLLCGCGIYQTEDERLSYILLLNIDDKQHIEIWVKNMSDAPVYDVSADVLFYPPPEQVTLQICDVLQPAEAIRTKHIVTNNFEIVQIIKLNYK